MASEQDSVSWGVNKMSMIFPRPKTGTAVLIEGPRKLSLRFVIEMLCEEISSDSPVYWVDGGMSLDPSALILSVPLKLYSKFSLLNFIKKSLPFCSKI